MALKDWKKFKVNDEIMWKNKEVGTLSIEKLQGLYYVRVYKGGVLMDSLAWGTKSQAIEDAKSYMRSH